MTRKLGDDWYLVIGAEDIEGIASNPARFLLWGDRLVVGLDDEYVHLFAATTEGGTVDVGDAIAYSDLGDHETMSVSEFARLLRTALERPPERGGQTVLSGQLRSR